MDKQKKIEGGSQIPCDIFLCHNRLDQPIVKQIAEGLELEFGITNFLDDYSIPVGEEFLPWIEAALASSKGCAIFLGENGWGPTHLVEAQKALLRYQSDSSFKLIPVVLKAFANSDGESLGSVFKDINWVRIDKFPPEIEAIEKLRNAIVDEPENIDSRPTQLTPYLLRREAIRWAKYRNDDILPVGKALAEAQELLITAPELTAGTEVSMFLQAASQRVATRLRRLIAISLGSSLIFLVLAIVAFQQYIVATSREHAALALTMERPEHALMLAVESFDIQPTVESRSALMRLLNRMPGLKYFLNGAEDGVRVVDIDENKRWAVAAGEGADVYLWDLSDPGKSPVIFPAPPNLGIGTNRVHDLQISSSGAFVTVAYERGGVRIWSPMTAAFSTIDGWPVQNQGSLKTGTDYVGPDSEPPNKRGERPVISLSINSDETLGAAIDSSGRIFVFDIKKSKIIRTIYTDFFGVLSVAWTPGGDYVLASDGSGKFQVYDHFGNSIKQRNDFSHRAKIVLVAEAKTQDKFITLDQQGVLNYWDPDTNNIISSEKLNLSYTVIAASLAPDFEYVYLTTREGLIRKVSLSTFEEDEAGSLAGHRLTATSLKCKRDHYLCISGGVGGDVLLWDLAQQHPLLKKKRTSKELIDSFWRKGNNNLGYLAYGNGKLGWYSLIGNNSIIRPIDHVSVIAARNRTDEIVIASNNENAIWYSSFDVQKGKLHSLNDGNLQQLFMISVSDNGKWLAAIGTNNTVAVWHRDNPESAHVVYSIDGTASRISFSPQQDSIVIGTLSGDIYRFNFSSDNAETKKVKVANGPIFALAFTKSGDTLFIGSGAGDRNIRAMNYPLLEDGFTFPERHAGSMSNLTVLADINILASASDDGEIVLWDLESQREISSLRHERDTLFRAIMYDDRHGKLYAASSHTVFEWHVNDKAIVKAACDAANLPSIKPENELLESINAGVNYCLSINF